MMGAASKSDEESVASHQIPERGPESGLVTPPAPEECCQSPEGVVLVTTIDIGNGQSRVLHLKRADDPEHIAANFVKQHHLPQAVVEPLVAHLHEHMLLADRVRTMNVQLHQRWLKT